MATDLRQRGLRSGWASLDALFARVPGEFRRPVLFDLIFWGDLAVVLASGAFSFLNGGTPVNRSLLVLITALLAATWLVLPWDPSAPRRRKLAVPALLLATFALGHVTVFLWAMPLYAMSVANAVFLLGFRPAVVVACVTPFMVGISTFFATGTMSDVGLAGAAFTGALMIPVSGFVFGICKLLAEAVGSRRALEAANAELQRQALKIRELAVGEERTRVAREVHDALGHHLTAINLQLQNAERFSDKDPARVLERVREARAGALAALADVRRSVRALRPVVLEEKPLPSTLADLTRAFDGIDFKVEYAVRGEARCLPSEHELALYRATQEGLTNAARHSGAQNVWVTLTYGDGGGEEGVALAVADDGCGMADGTATGFGLSALGGRIRDVGGTLLTANRPEGGTRLEVTLPPTHEEKPA